MSPHQRTAIVTGASSGVGLALTRMLIDAGFTVHAHYRTAPAFEHESVQWWQSSFPALENIPALREVDALIHCAGVCELNPVASSSVEEWRTTMDVNLFAPVELTNHLLPALREARGHVVYINSGAGLRANPNWGSYAASKFAARAWCDALRGEEPDIRVTSVHPGRIDTPMQRAIVAAEGGNYDGSRFLQAETVATAVLNVLNLPQDAQPTELVLRPRG